MQCWDELAVATVLNRDVDKMPRYHVFDIDDQLVVSKVQVLFLILLNFHIHFLHISIPSSTMPNLASLSDPKAYRNTSNPPNSRSHLVTNAK